MRSGVQKFGDLMVDDTVLLDPEYLDGTTESCTTTTCWFKHFKTTKTGPTHRPSNGSNTTRCVPFLTWANLDHWSSKSKTLINLPTL